MKTILRASLTLSVLAAAIASQALTLAYTGVGALGSNATTATTAIDDFKFATSTTTLNTLTLFDATGKSGLTITAAGLTPAVGSTMSFFANAASAVGFGTYAGYASSPLMITVTANNNTVYSVSAQGTVNPVPEPASVAALGLGALGLLRRRRRA